MNTKYEVDLEATPEENDRLGLRRLRSGLKALRRRFGLKCLRVRTVNATTQIARAHGEGWDALCTGEALTHNPYPRNTPKHRAWRSGWLSAQDHYRD